MAVPAASTSGAGRSLGAQWCGAHLPPCLFQATVTLEELRTKKMDTWSRQELGDWLMQVRSGKFKDCTQPFMQLDGEDFALFTEAQIKEEVKGPLGSALFNCKQQWLTPGMLFTKLVALHFVSLSFTLMPCWSPFV